MGRIYTSDLVIGNYIINSIKHNIYTITEDEIVDYNNRIKERVKGQYTPIFYRSAIYEFAKHYSWLIDPITYEISKSADQDKLVRFFQSASPDLIKIMEEEYQK